MPGSAYSPGHTVLAVTVPALDAFVRARTAHYDASFVSADPAFVHAHVTVLAPWVPRPSAADLATIGRIAAAHPAFALRLARIEAFPDGVLHLRPEPDAPLRALTAAVTAAFPDHPPYGGRYPHVDPHLTLDRHDESATPPVTRTWLHKQLADVLPVSLTVERLELQWWANHDCRVLANWPLGREVVR
ncbi:2'-5' RNA ligase family protein [Nocardioides sp. TRM66260-LWL]|uniref:2'-5' RNA ligase family protein n=1 Tax=Nocardioides sp. TRM66260-LWL TaxID=2874478 RepID=UPI001CC6E7C0|nr:2'-5' RNA ligase family protein [Nocardioides sp. TRM66260-LWL]MBZ5734064.1 2'-5' RNA ligase family protein [Nocardioides sp. TRM66260-LWL]